uniref:Ig-like domain-containing protein n=1 Tax=Cyanistes caeruleus TaxID=156563 RepID=A0A8C0ZD77_CYACU
MKQNQDDTSLNFLGSSQGELKNMLSQITGKKTVAIFSPSKQEIQQKSKATLVCLASGFYPDHLTLTWRVNGMRRTEGVGTDESSTRNGSTYSLTSRLRMPAWEWFNPLNRFECVADFFYNGTTQSINKFIYGDAESYLRYGNSLKLTYLILCGKALVYAVLVSGLVWTAKVSPGAPGRLGLLTSQGSVHAD